MKTIGKLLLTGLLAVLPLGLTAYVIWWLGSGVEAILGWLWHWALPGRVYSPGMGVLFGFALLLSVGLLMNAVLARRLMALLEGIVERIPLVKTVYGSVKDLLSLFAGAGGTKKGIDQVVLVPLGETSVRVLGLVTRTAVTEVEVAGETDPLTAVYVPMSYGIGGYTILVRRSTLVPLRMSVEQALRFAVTAGAPSTS